MKITLELNESEIKQAIKEYIYNNEKLDKQIVKLIILKECPGCGKSSFSADVILEEEPLRENES